MKRRFYLFYIWIISWLTLLENVSCICILGFTNYNYLKNIFDGFKINREEIKKENTYELELEKSFEKKCIYNYKFGMKWYEYYSECQNCGGYVLCNRYILRYVNKI